MAAEAPTQHAYHDYLDLSAGHLKHVLLRDAWNPLRWRGDASDRIHGGARRTYLPYPNTRLDALLFSGNEEFRLVMDTCLDAANRLMGELFEDGSWVGNRVVMNRMPPHRSLSSHDDPTHFKDGVVVISAGPARLMYEAIDGSEQVLEDGLESLVHIPAGVPHRVENGKLDRISIVVTHDTQLAAGRSAVGQYFGNLTRRALDSVAGH